MTLEIRKHPKNLVWFDTIRAPTNEIAKEGVRVYSSMLSKAVKGLRIVPLEKSPQIFELHIGLGSDDAAEVLRNKLATMRKILVEKVSPDLELGKERELREDPLQAPFPYWGGKSRASEEIWKRLGDVGNYVEPFAGSLAVLLGRPTKPKIETVNDLDGLLSNFWRAMSKDAEAVAAWADEPVNEADLHGRHLWLVRRRDDLCSRLMADPDYYDPKVAGWWVWGICAWIGSGWCSGNGCWDVNDDGLLVRQLPHLSHQGQGINRKRPHLGDQGQGINRQRPHLGKGQGINRQLPHLSNQGQGILEWFQALQVRLRRVRVCCGDWTRVLGDSVLRIGNVCGVVLDPPYDHTLRNSSLYRVEMSCSASVRQWAIEHGNEPHLRIALCGYGQEHTMPAEWSKHMWKTKGGYGSQSRGKINDNSYKECVWFSPHCLTGDS